METVKFIILHYAIILCTLLSSFLLSQFFIRNLRFQSGIERAFFSTSLGLGIWAAIIFLLGIAGLLYKEAIIGINVFILIITLIRKDLRSILAKFWRPDKQAVIDIIIIFSILSIIYPIFVLFLYPPASWDAISYHLAISKVYTNSHKLILTEFVRFPVFNQLTEMLFTGMFLLADDIAAQSVSWISNLIIAFGLFGMCNRFFNRSTAILSLVFWLSAPLIIHLSSVAYIDINLSMFAFAGIYSGFVYLFGYRNKNWIYLSAVFFGFAIGSKYSGLIVFCLFTVFMIIVKIKSGNSNDSKDVIKTNRIRKLVPLILKFGLIVLIVCSPWFIRNYYYSGNPVFPFMNSIFGTGNLWNKADYIALMQDLVVNHGLEKNMVNLLDLPHSLSFHQEKFLLEAPFTPAVFIGLLMFLAAPRKNGMILSAFFLCVTYVMCWFYSAQIPRYLLVIWPLQCIVFGWALDYWLSEILKEDLLKLSAVGVISVVLLYYYPLVFLQQEVMYRGPVPVTVQDRDIYLAKLLPTYPAYSYLNQKKPAGRLYALRDENMNYFYKGTFIGDWFGPGRYSQIYSNLNSGQALYKALKKLNADYFLVNIGRFTEPLPNDDFFRKKFILEFENKSVKVFSIK